MSLNIQIDLGKVLTNVGLVSSVFDTIYVSIMRTSTFLFDINRVLTHGLSLNTQIDIGKVLTIVGLESSAFDTTQVLMMRISILISTGYGHMA